MKTRATSRATGLAMLLGLAGVSGFSQTQGPVTVLGQVESIEASSRIIRMKTTDGASLTVTLAENGNVVKVAPGEKSLQNAAPIEFGAITVGDRLMVRGGTRTADRIDGALRMIVMARTDLAARDEAEQRAWRESAIVGTVTAVDPVQGEFTLQISPTASAGAAPPRPGTGSGSPATVVVDGTKATFHRYSDTSVRFADAVPARLEDIALDDQLRLLGTRSKDGARVTADRVVFGHFKTLALEVEKVDAGTGLVEVKDLESNKKFTISVVASASIRKIPPEMAALLGVLSGATGGRPFGQRPSSGPPAGGRPEGGRSEGGRGTAQGVGMGPGGMGPGGMGPRPGGGGTAPGRGLEDMLKRMPTISIADLKKDDWIGAVVGRIDASGRAFAFNILAGIEVFASRANRGGGVDVGMPAGLLDGGGVP